MKPIAFGTLLCVSLISFGLSMARKPLRSPNPMPSTVAGGPLGLQQPTEDDLLRAYAWNVLKRLTVDSNGTSKSIADWETWTPKCEIHLGAPCTSTQNLGPFVSLLTVSNLLTEIEEKIRPLKGRDAPADFNGPRQLADKLKAVLEPTEEQMSQAQRAYFQSIGAPLQQVHVKSLTNASASGPILASVMLNKEAVDSIRPLATRPPTPGGEPTIKPGTMLTKAIWTVRKLDSTNTGNNGVCLSGQHAPSVTRVKWSGTSEGYPSMPATLPNPHDLSNPAAVRKAWSTPKISCAGGDSIGPSGEPIPISLFHAFGVQTEDIGVPPAPVGQLGEASAEASGRVAVRAECGNKSNCLALMMGIHIMAKISPADGRFGTDTNPIWVFMTFWWTPDDNNTGLPAPWNHYQLNVTTNPRIDHDGKADNIVFSPYLEGLSVPAGAEANCVTCHSLARYNAKMTGSDLRNDGSTCGNLLIGQSAPRDCGASGKYLTDSNSVPIDKVWSIVSLLDCVDPAAGKPLPSCEASPNGRLGKSLRR